MFENAKPPAIPLAPTKTARDVSNADQFTDWSGMQSDCADATPLRTIEWSELTARFSAARDLRQLLRDNVEANTGPAGLGFADAASQFFRATEEDERCVNPNALGPRKTSSGKDEIVECRAPLTGKSAADEGPEKSRSARKNPSETREEQ